MQTTCDIHIGRAIQTELHRQGRSVAWLAAQLCYTRGNVYRIFHSPSIDTTTLFRISRLLNFNFFSLYAVYF